MVHKFEIIDKDDNLILNGDGILPYRKGDKLYLSISRFYPRDEEIYRKKYEPIFSSFFIDGFLSDIEAECKEYNIKRFRVVKVTNSINKDYSKSLNSDDNDGINHTVTYVVKEVIRWKFWRTYKFKQFWKKIFKTLCNKA